MIVGCRVLIGIAVGIACVACPLYVSELAPDERRGFLVSAFQLFLTIGIILAYGASFLVTKYVPDTTNDIGWRMQFYFGALFPFIMVNLLSTTRMTSVFFFSLSITFVCSIRSRCR